MQLQVAPAELEGVLIAHPDIADVGVIGVWSEKQQTELPRWVSLFHLPCRIQLTSVPGLTGHTLSRLKVSKPSLPQSPAQHSPPGFTSGSTPRCVRMLAQYRILAHRICFVGGSLQETGRRDHSHRRDASAVRSPLCMPE